MRPRPLIEIAAKERKGKRRAARKIQASKPPRSRETPSFNLQWDTGGFGRLEAEVLSIFEKTLTLILSHPMEEGNWSRAWNWIRRLVGYFSGGARKGQRRRHCALPAQSKVGVGASLVLGRFSFVGCGFRSANAESASLPRRPRSCRGHKRAGRCFAIMFRTGRPKPSTRRGCYKKVFGKSGK